MSNVLVGTEALADTDFWQTYQVTVTGNTADPPSIAGVGATRAATIDDEDVANVGDLHRSTDSIPNDASAWIASCFIRKDTNQARFPALRLVFLQGTLIWAEAELNTQTGATAGSPANPPTASGAVDVDANWWRLWLKFSNNASGNTTAQVKVYPAFTSTLGAAGDVASVGSIVAWGVNLTNTDSLQPYEPNPWYGDTLNVELWEPTLGMAPLN